METKHTQGEWLANEGQIYPAETGKILALIPYFDKENKEQEANAKLIAAAPELLDVLNHIIERISVVRHNDAFCQALKDKAINAINKAK